MFLFHDHLCHPNHKSVLNNKDYNQYDNKGEAEQRGVHQAVDISLDYRLIWKYVKRQFMIRHPAASAQFKGVLPLTLSDAGDINAPNMNPGCFGMSMSTTTSRTDREDFVVGQK